MSRIANGTQIELPWVRITAIAATSAAIRPGDQTLPVAESARDSWRLMCPGIGGVGLLEWSCLQPWGMVRVTKRHSPEFRRKVLDLLEGRRSVAEVTSALRVAAGTTYARHEQELVETGQRSGPARSDNDEPVAAGPRIAELETELAVTKRASEVSTGRCPKRRFATISVKVDVGRPTQVACRILGVSESGYYAWRLHPPSSNTSRSSTTAGVDTARSGCPPRSKMKCLSRPTNRWHHIQHADSREPRAAHSFQASRTGSKPSSSKALRRPRSISKRSITRSRMALSKSSQRARPASLARFMAVSASRSSVSALCWDVPEAVTAIPMLAVMRCSPPSIVVGSASFSSK